MYLGVSKKLKKNVYVHGEISAAKSHYSKLFENRDEREGGRNLLRASLVKQSRKQMGDEEIIQLYELKEELLEKAIRLRDRLKDREENGRRESINFNR